MKISDIENLLYPPHLALSPKIVLSRKDEIVEKYGLDNFINRREFKRAREMYHAAIYAIGTTALTGNYYWVAPSKDDPPDCFLMWVHINNQIFVECVEIGMWHDFVDDMWDIIKKKINKKYPSSFSIVIPNAKEGGSINAEYLQNLHGRLKKETISAGVIRFWMEIIDNPNGNILCGEFYPECVYKELSVNDILGGYALNPEVCKIDLSQYLKRQEFKKEDLEGLVFPDLPELSW